MFGKFLPRKTSFFDFFDQHTEVIIDASQELLKIILDNEESHHHALRITLLEKKADMITHHCIEELHKTFITPFERDDIYRLISHLDDIIDGIENVATRIVLYKLTSMPDSIKKLATVLAASIEEVQHVVRSLRQLKDHKLMQERFITIHRLENEADDILNKAIGRLFEEEKDPCMILKWKEIYENLEALTDSCEDIANIVDGVIIEST